jgi:zinc protease
MRITFLSILLAGMVISAIASQDDLGYKRKTLSNGLEIVVIENNLVPIVTVEICTRNGSFTESPDYNGLSHLYEHMFFKANANLPTQEKYMARLHELGIHFNGTTHDEFVNYFFTLPRVNFEAGMKFMADAIMTPKFDQQELEKEREVVLGEFDRNEAQPIFPLIRALDSAVWYKYPSRKQPLGERPTIKTATVEKMLTIQRKYYIPNNSMLVVAGDVSAEEVYAQAEKYLGAWQPGEDPFARTPIPDHPALPEKQLIVRTAAQLPIAITLMTWHGPSVGKDDAATYAADVFFYILNQSTSKFQSRLIESGLAQQMSAGYQTQKYVGPIQVFARSLPNKLPDMLKALHEEMKKWDTDDYFTDEELATAKHVLRVQNLYAKEQTSDYVHNVSFNWASCGFDYWNNYQENVDKVTRQDMKDFVHKYILGKNYVLGVAMSDEAIQQLKLDPKEVLQ